MTVPRLLAPRSCVVISPSEVWATCSFGAMLLTGLFLIKHWVTQPTSVAPQVYTTCAPGVSAVSLKAHSRKPTLLMLRSALTNVAWPCAVPMPSAKKAIAAASARPARWVCFANVSAHALAPQIPPNPRDWGGCIG